MTERFTETLRLASASDWSASVGHRFVRELCDGSIPDRVGPAQAAQARDFFARAVMLERAFFDAAYAAS